MPFPESLKLQVKQKAAFRCCRCQNIGIDVHHIVPEKDGGSNDIDNAAPLCPSCHDYFRNNPSKQKEIAQMRDFWYHFVNKKWQSTGVDGVTLGDLDAKVSSIKNETADISELKSMLKTISDSLINNMTAGTASVTTSGIVNVVATSSEGSRPTLYPRLHCRNCGAPITFPIQTNKCLACGIELF